MAGRIWAENGAHGGASSVSHSPLHWGRRMSDIATVHLVDDDEFFLTAMSRLLRAEDSRSTLSLPDWFLAQISADVRGCVVADLEHAGAAGLELQTRLARAAGA